MTSIVTSPETGIVAPAKTALPKLTTAVLKTKPVFLQEIRLMQAFAILCVVFAHAVVPGRRFTGPFELLDRFIRTSTVPLFICASGYLYHYVNGSKKLPGDFIRERMLRLMWPYFALSTVAFVIKANLGSLASRSLHFTLSDYVHQLCYPWDNAIIFFWYLPTLFLICIPSTYIDRWIIQKSARALLPVLVVLAVISCAIGIDEAHYPVRFLNASGALSYLVYFWIGYGLSKYDKQISPLFVTPFRAVSFLLGCMIITMVFSAPDHTLAFFEATAATIALVMFAKQMSRWREWPLIAKIGDNSYQIYLLSWFFQTMPIIVFSRWVSQNFYVVALVSTTLGIAGPMFVASLVRHHLPVFKSVLGLK